MKLRSEDILVKTGSLQFLKSATGGKNGHTPRKQGKNGHVIHKQAHLEADEICFKLEVKLFHKVTIINPVNLFSCCFDL